MRLPWIDRWKGLLIVLVVAGHVVGGASHFCTGMSSETMSFLYKVIYMFHMPAFFCLAGLLAGRGVNSPRAGSFRDFVADKARRLLVPYLVFGLFSALVYVLLAHRGTLFGAATDGYYQNLGVKELWQPFAALVHGGGLPRDGFRCNSVLWFLPAMFSCLCFLWLVRKFVKSTVAQLALAIGLLTFEFLNRKYGLVGVLPFGLSHIPWYGSFVIIGNVASCIGSRFASHGDQPQLSSSRLAVTPPFNYHFSVHCLFLLIIFFVIACYLTPNCYYGQFNAVWYLAFFAMALVGIVLSAMLSRHFSWTWLEKCGRASLGIMLLHKFAVLLLQVKLPFVSRLSDIPLAFFVANLLVLAAAVAASWLLTIVIRRYAPWAIGEFSRRLNPSS